MIVYAGGSASDAFESMYRAFGRSVLTGAPHPLAGESALADLEVIMAIYESARTHTRLQFPLRQDAFPLPLMFE